jgi:hypothetical protein
VGPAFSCLKLLKTPGAAARVPIDRVLPIIKSSSSNWLGLSKASQDKVKLRRIKKQTPDSAQPRRLSDRWIAADQDYVWEVLVPCLLHPAKLAIVRALLEQGRPLSLTHLAEAAEISVDLARYQCKSMETARVLEVVSVAPRANGEGDEPSYFFVTPPQAPG